jgi:CheY-like chemotaxis protein
MVRSASPSVLPHTLDLGRTRLLIIEDDNVHRMIIKRFADALGYDVAEAGSYERAIALFGEQQFDCITLDLSIETHSGTEVLRHLWNIGRRIPVLVISGADEAKRAETALYAESMKFDIIHVVRKPLDLKSLQDALAQLKAFVELSTAPQV